MPLAARGHQLAHRQQFEHFEPRHLGPALGQALAPERDERDQPQFIPQPTPQPAITKRTRVLESQFGELNFQTVENVGRDLAVLGEEADLLGQLIDFIDHVQTFAPGRLLGVIDLAQIKGRALGGMTHAQTAVLHDAPVAMLFAIFLAGVIAQKHVVRWQCTTLGRQFGRGWVSTCD